MEIPPIDIACEAVSVLRDLCSKVSEELKRSGARSPNRSGDADNARRAAMMRFAEESITGLISVAAGTPQPTRNEADRTNKFGTIRALMQAFKSDPKSGYSKLKFSVRQNHGRMFAVINRDVGEVSLSDVRIDTIMRWYARWSANGKHLATGHSYIGRVKAMLRYGASTAEDTNCIRLYGALRAANFAHGKTKVRRIDADDANAVRATAHRMKLPSLALAQAFQFDLKLYDPQVVGEWVPLTEPGESSIKSRTVVWRWGSKGTRPGKWLRGLMWSQIDANYILRREVNGQISKIDLKRYPMVMAELKRMGQLPKSGPVIVYEKTGSPYTYSQYRYLWRAVATKAGIPKAVYNVTGNHRDERIGEVGKTSDDEICSVVSSVCASVPADFRDDVLNEMVADVKSGDISLQDLEKARPQYVKRHYAAFNNRFRNVSLDQPLSGSNDLRLIDVLPSDQSLWR